MRSCKIASELTATEGLRRLSLWERISLGIHRVICVPCRAYKRQIQHFNNTMLQVHELDAAPKFKMDDEMRARIAEKVRQSGNNEE